MSPIALGGAATAHFCEKMQASVRATFLAVGGRATHAKRIAQPTSRPASVYSVQPSAAAIRSYDTTAAIEEAPAVLAPASSTWGGTRRSGSPPGSEATRSSAVDVRYQRVQHGPLNVSRRRAPRSVSPSISAEGSCTPSFSVKGQTLSVRGQNFVCTCGNSKITAAFFSLSSDG